MGDQPPTQSFRHSHIAGLELIAAGIIEAITEAVRAYLPDPDQEGPEE